MRINFLEKILIWWGLYWGILAMGLYFLGLAGLFYRSIIISFAALCLILLLYFIRKDIISVQFKDYLKYVFTIIRKDWVIVLILIAFLSFAVLNFLINLAPEVGFDALWYHLTLPKIYLMTHHVSYLPGGLLYYSVMPRLVEMMYGFGLSVSQSAAVPKMIHFLFGLAWAGGVYITAREYLTRRGALAAALVSYGTYLVTWLSATAYIDLVVAFYAALALWGVLRYLNSEENGYLYLAAIFMGLTLSGKLYGLILLVVLVGLLIFSKTSWKMVLSFAGIAIAIVLPFYLQAYFSTGNPIYPVFSVKESALAMYTGGYNNLKDWYLEGWWRNLPHLFWGIVVYRFAPIFSLVFLVFFAKEWKKMLPLLIVFLSFFFLWSLNPVQEPRYFIVILPVLATISIYTLANISWKVFKVLVFVLLLIGFVYNLTYAKSSFEETLELVFGHNPRENYLKARLTPPRNFYDFSGNFGREIRDSKVLTVNVHNLFYIDFNFYDWSFIENRYKNQTIQDIADSLNHNDFKFVLIGERDISWWLGANQDDSAKYFQLILSQDGFNLYQLKMD